MAQSLKVKSLLLANQLSDDEPFCRNLEFVKNKDLRSIKKDPSVRLQGVDFEISQ